MKQEIRELLRRINNSGQFTGYGDAPNIVDDYNKLLERLQEKYPNNPLIQKKLPIDYPPFTRGDDLIDEVEHNCKMFLDNLTEKDKPTNSPINITIGSMEGNFSFDNIISTIQNSNIGNQTEIINYVKEFRAELQKPNPSRTKLQDYIKKLEGLGAGVITGLIIETGKVFLGI